MANSEPQTRTIAVLIVDDENEIRSMLASALAADGYSVLEAGTVWEAQNIMRAGAEVDVVVSDVRMPGGADGNDLAVWLYRYAPRTILILTSGYFPPDQAHAAPLVFGHRLPKPYRPSQILRLIEQGLMRRERESPVGGRDAGRFDRRDF
jgi:two-component system, cell cycle response regulator CpdR